MWKLQASQVLRHHDGLATAISNVLEPGFSGHAEDSEPFTGKLVLQFEPQISPVLSTEDAVIGRRTTVRILRNASFKPFVMNFLLMSWSARLTIKDTYSPPHAPVM